MIRRMIINADDLGIDEPRSRGILEAHRKGIVTSGTLLGNTPLLEQVRGWILDCPRLGIGVHLNISEGSAILSHPRTLVDRQGQFFGKAETLRRLMEGRLDVEEIQTEFDLQIRRIRDAGIEPTHLDAHHHVHLYPGVMAALCWTARRHDISKVRLPREPVPAPGTISSAIYWELVRYQGLVSKAAETLTAAGLRTTDHFRGIALKAGIHLDRFVDVLARLPEGTTEVMVHPRLAQAGTRSFATEDREKELRLLTDPGTRKAVAEHGIELITFREL